MTTPIPRPRRHWKFKAEVALDVQGLIATQFAHLEYAEALFLELPPRAGGAWLAALRETITISDATGSREDDCAAALAFTCSGLQRMNLPDTVLRTFSAPFREGMHEPERKRRLGDTEATVIAEGSLWSGNPDGSDQAPTPKTVHAVLIVYARDADRLLAQVSAADAVLSRQGVAICHRHLLTQQKDACGFSREHFGFADGVSQPIPTGEAVLPPEGGEAQESLRWHGVPAGEIVLGYTDIHDEPAPGPIVPADERAVKAGLPRGGAPSGHLDLGINGSYLVVRELRQDVTAFWRSMATAAAALGQPHINADWLAARVVGRTLDGDGLLPTGLRPRTGEVAGNDFGYAHDDVHGFGCPLGSHVRRANPRDSLPSRDAPEPDLGQTADLLFSANAHRILRRGRKFGPPILDRYQDDRQIRGLMFMCLNSDIARHFEFVQQTWLLNPNFATLHDETDPLLGPAGPFTVPACPVRLRPRVQTYIRLAGGEYFFLPSLPALRYLATL